jgi:ribosomal protein S3AE
LVAHKFQRELQDTLRKIYPLQVCELRDVHIETSENGLKNILSAPPAVEKPKEEAPVEQQAEQQEAQPEQPAQEPETREAA